MHIYLSLVGDFVFILSVGYLYRNKEYSSLITTFNNSYNETQDMVELFEYIDFFNNAIDHLMGNRGFLLCFRRGKNLSSQMFQIKPLSVFNNYLRIINDYNILF